LAYNFHTDITALANNSVIASYSCSSNPEPVLPCYALANLGATINFVQGFRIPGIQKREGEQALFELANSGNLSIAAAKQYQFEEIADAHVRVEQVGLGNTVLTFPESPG
jgi:NADPH2:quinone reductase